MTSVNARRARKNLYQLIEDVNAEATPVTITSPRGNAVLVSENDWTAIQEALYLGSIPGLVSSVLTASGEGLDQASEKLDW